MQTLVHLSDLHLGRDAQTKRRTVTLRNELLSANVDHIVVTGNVTWSGRRSEWETFRRIFAAFDAEKRLTVVPGYHDRLGDDLAHVIQPGPRVAVESTAGLYLIRFDSTGSDEIAIPREQGRVTDDDLARIDEALAAAPWGKLVVLLMHHELLPLLSEHAPERLMSWLSRSYQQELERGRRLLSVLRGRCDLVLQGHAAVPSCVTPFATDERPFSVCNAGSSTDVGRVRAFWHQTGRLAEPPAWLTSAEGKSGWLRPSRLDWVFRGSSASRAPA